MGLSIETNGSYSLTDKEMRFLEIVNEYKFELKTGEIIHFQDVIDKLGLKLVLDGSAKRAKLINPSCWKLNENVLHSPVNQGQDESSTVANHDVDLIKTHARPGGVDTTLIQNENSKIIEQLSKKIEQLGLGTESSQYWIEDEKCSIKALIEKLRPIKVLVEDCYLDSYPLKGLFSSSDKSVTLYMDNMSKQNRLVDVVFVYIHEMFHAYYCLCRGKGGQYVREIEECMAEFGMLTFIESLKDGNKDFDEIFNSAKEEVESKRYNIGDLAAYGFGKYIFDHCDRKKDWISAYSQRSDEFDKKNSDVCKYIDSVYPFYPINEYGTRKLLAHLLFDVNQHKMKFNHFDAFHSVALRILLIDDKVGSQDEKDKTIIDDKVGSQGKNDTTMGCVNKKIMEMTPGVEKTLSVKKCPDIDCAKKQCKLCTIKRLMDDGNMFDGKAKLYDGIGWSKDYFYWQEKDIDCYYCPTFIPDFIDDITKLNGFNQINLDFDIEETKDKEEVLSIKCDFEPKPNGKVQIVGVRDVRTALLLMSKFKFDMVFCDYLLDYKSKDNTGPRDYANQFFDFLSHDYKKEIKLANESDKGRLRILDRLRSDVLDNRGPLDKLWIMPITGFNQTFIQDLYRNQIDLIGHKWNISNGADPITTPWQFLYHLNKFIELQIKQCVYDMAHLLRFLHYSCLDFNEKFKEVDATGKKFFAFQAFMGSEYASFIRRYGNRLIIRRDASCKDDKDTDAQSVFATYVWNKFYANPEYRDEIELNRLIRNFLHQASTMHNDLEGKKQLEEDFGLLCHFINNNIKVRNVIEKENDLKNELEIGLNELHNKMDVLTCNLSIDES